MSPIEAIPMPLIAAAPKPPMPLPRKKRKFTFRLGKNKACSQCRKLHGRCIDPFPCTHCRKMGYTCKKQEQSAGIFRTADPVRRAQLSSSSQASQDKGKLSYPLIQPSQRTKAVPDTIYIPYVARDIPIKPVVRKELPHCSLQSTMTNSRKVCSGNDESEPVMHNTEPEPGISLHIGVYLYYDDKSAIFNNDNMNTNTPRPRYVV
ncbi:hypothetical protein GGI35DRAFT_463180 [Trichoderma velutinum]